MRSFRTCRVLFASMVPPYYYYLAVGKLARVEERLFISCQIPMRIVVGKNHEDRGNLDEAWRSKLQCDMEVIGLQSLPDLSRSILNFRIVF